MNLNKFLAFAFLPFILCRKSDYKRILFSDEVKEKLENNFQVQYNKSDDEVKELYKKLSKELEHQNLVRLQPENVIGSSRVIEIKDNRKTTFNLTTVSKRRPLLFQIDDFLMGDECDHIKMLIKKAGMEKSRTFGDVDMTSPTQPTIYDLIGEIPFEEVDENEDSVIDIEELRREFRNDFDNKMGTLKLQEIMKETMMDFNLDGVISEWEWNLKNNTRLVHMLQASKAANPSGAVRFSETQWLKQTDTQDEVLLSLRDRVHKVTQLPITMINNGEQLQVVHYKPGGHYDCHLDSDPSYYPDTFMPCCHTYIPEHDDDNRCSACRFLTILFYLDETERGGETAFPITGVDPYKNNIEDMPSNDICDLTIHCQQSRVVVRPRKGRAVLWYNHFIDPDTNWIGAVDRNSLHGGCAVHAGTKWIANNWINAGYLKKHDILMWAENTIHPPNTEKEQKEDDSTKVKNSDEKEQRSDENQSNDESEKANIEPDR